MTTKAIEEIRALSREELLRRHAVAPKGSMLAEVLRGALYGAEPRAQQPTTDADVDGALREVRRGEL